ncbi:MAG TPA: potassium channel family protein [Candidatus Sabulitectum sp.]|nr:potassium channel family protein [Candidatus Sabulitectum sp.]
MGSISFLPFVFTLRFLELFITGLFMVSPVIILLLVLLFLIARATRRAEKWKTYSGSLYFTLITALTIGYGRTVPSTSRGRILSVLSGFIGVILTGIIVSVALNSVMLAWQATHDTPMEMSIEQVMDRLGEKTDTRPSQVYPSAE